MLPSSLLVLSRVAFLSSLPLLLAGLLAFVLLLFFALALLLVLVSCHPNSSEFRVQGFRA